MGRGRSIEIAVLFLSLFLVCSGYPAARAESQSTESQLVDRPRRELFPVVKIETLDPATRQLAEELEIWPLLIELYKGNAPKSREQSLLLRNQILETILEAYFDVGSVRAEASREVTRLTALLERLSSKRDRAVNLNNATNFIASGTLNTIGSILGFSASTPPFSGNLNQMLSGVVSTGMSTYALKQNNGGKISPAADSTVLAELFGRPTSAATSYPESVWRFLHSKAPTGNGLTRAELLEQHWISRRHLEPHGSRREKLKIDIVCGLPTGKNVTIDDLSDQVAMITDVAMVAELMTHHLRDLIRMIDSDVVPVSDSGKSGGTAN